MGVAPSSQTSDPVGGLQCHCQHFFACLNPIQTGGGGGGGDDCAALTLDITFF